MRDSTFDVMKGIGIIAMIIGHLQIPHLLRDFIFSFHMPMFFLIGGYFYKPQSIKDIIHKSSIRLLKPYIITGVLTFLIYFLVGDIDTAIFRGSGILFGNNGSPEAIFQTPRCGAVWFLLALFWCRIMFNYLYTKTRFWLILTIVLSIAATCLGYYIINPPLGIVIGMSSLIFFSIGKALKEYNIKMKRIIVLSIIIWILCVLFSKLEMAIYLYKYYPLDIVGACGGTFVIFFIAKGICSYTKILKSFFLFIGVNSLLVLCYHQLVDHSVAAINNNIVTFHCKAIINIVLPIIFTIIHVFIGRMYTSTLKA